MNKKESEFVNKLLTVLAILTILIATVFFAYIIVNIARLTELPAGSSDILRSSYESAIKTNILCLFGSAFIGTLIITILYICKSKRKIKTEVDFATTNIDEKILNESEEKEE